MPEHAEVLELLALRVVCEALLCQVLPRGDDVTFPKSVLLLPISIAVCNSHGFVKARTAFLPAFVPHRSVAITPAAKFFRSGLGQDLAPIIAQAFVAHLEEQRPDKWVAGGMA